jgi:hypothetical protein
MHIDILPVELFIYIIHYCILHLHIGIDLLTDFGTYKTAQRDIRHTLQLGQNNLFNFAITNIAETFSPN